MCKKTAILDLTGCKDYHDFHQRIQKQLEFPEHYGANWDAFWDCINRDCEVDVVIVVGSGTVAKELQPLVQTMIEILEENKQDLANSRTPFDYVVMS